MKLLWISLAETNAVGLITYWGLLSLFGWQLWNTFWNTSRSYRNMLLPLNILYLILMGCESGFSRETEPTAWISNKMKFISLTCQCDLYNAIVIAFILEKRKYREMLNPGIWMLPQSQAGTEILGGSGISSPVPMLEG